MIAEYDKVSGGMVAQTGETDVKHTWRWMTESVGILGLALAVVFGVSGCGGSDGEEDPPDNGTPPPTTAARYALAIGIDHYAPGYASSLPSCINDANGFAGELRKDTALWNSANITVMTDSSARLASIRSKMQQLAGTARSGDLVVYFHSSHGGDAGTRDTVSDSVPDATFLCAYDTEYEDEVFAQDLARFVDGVSIVVVLDACFSAGMYKGGPVFAFPERVMSKLAANCKARAVKGPSVGWMASSDYTETSAAGPTYSRFTQYLIEAFKNGDADHSGKLTFKELFDYSKPRTQPAHNPQSYNSALLASLVAAAVDPNAPTEGSGGGGGGGGSGSATLRVVNNFRLDQTIYIDGTQVGIVRTGQSQNFSVSAGTHTVRAWDSVTGSLSHTFTLADGGTETFTIVAASMSKAAAE